MRVKLFPCRFVRLLDPNPGDATAHTSSHQPILIMFGNGLAERVLAVRIIVDFPTSPN